jgi:hypothetical protein
MKPASLDYARAPIGKLGQNPFVALLLCLPGILCWIILLMPNAVALLWPEMNFTDLIVLWGLAVVTAIVSTVFYWRVPKAWFVIACLTINTCGLLYTIWFWLRALTA